MAKYDQALKRLMDFLGGSEGNSRSKQRAPKPVSRTRRWAFGVTLLLVVVIVVSVAIIHLHAINHGILAPAGPIARAQRQLIFIALLLSVFVVVPVFVLTTVIVMKYRVGAKPATYTPEWDNSRKLETLWWLLPTAIIGILSVITWQSTHQLDPYRSLSSTQSPLNIQVIALDWKWLFIYPDAHVASVNLVELPVGRPVRFQLTSDAPMNSFWIPQLGGQIYAMPGMSTELNLEADKTGIYRGLSANISGVGFAGMSFKAQAVSNADYNVWLSRTATASAKLDQSTYNNLAKPSQYVPVSTYASVTPNLYNEVVMKYLLPASQLNVLSAANVVTGKNSAVNGAMKSGMEMQ